MKLKTTISIILLTLFCGVSVFSQESSDDTSITPELSKIPLIGRFPKRDSKNVIDKDFADSQCNIFNESDFVGQSISINVVNTDVRDILLYIADEYGFQFVMDKSATNTKFVTRNVVNQPWNLILRDILKSQDLEMVANCPVIRIAKIGLYIGGMYCPGNPIKDIDELPLFTEFIKLKNIPELVKDDNTDNKSLNIRIGLGKFISIIHNRLSKKGTVEFDCVSKVIIITDIKENLNALVKLAEYIDKGEFYKLNQEEYKEYKQYEICSLENSIKEIKR